jgi:Domain of unknown function (DUF5753)
VIQVINPIMVPALLQTDDYAYKLITSETYGELAYRALDLRMERQLKVFERPDPAEVQFVISEAAIRRTVGDRMVMVRQLRRLLDIHSSATLSINIVPFTAGPTGFMRSFILLGFSSLDKDDLLCAEDAFGEMNMTSNEEKVARAHDQFDNLMKAALIGEQVRTFLNHVLLELGSVPDT